MSRSDRIKQIFRSLMPGIFLIGYNIGTGSLTAMSKAGANFGCDLLWAVLLSCLITWYLINFFSRFTMASGMTAMEAYHRHIHPAYAWILWGALSVIILSALMAMLGLLTDVILVWFQEAWAIEADRLLIGIALATLVYALILIGNTARFEALLSVLVALMGVAFIGSAIRFFPNAATVLSGFVPRMPAVAEGSDNSSMVILAGMVGTTVSVFAFLIRSGQVKDHGWTMADWRMQRRDAAVSATLMFVLSASVMITAAATLHEQALSLQEQGHLVSVEIPGGWDIVRELMGEEEACLGYYLQPELMHDIIATIRDTSVKVLERTCERITIDQLFVHEDMAGKSGPLIGPDTIREFIAPYYRACWDVVSSHGTRLFNQDSDGFMMPVIDVFLECGVNMMHPCEPAAGMDIVEIRKKYGHRLALLGGIDKHVLRQSKADIDRELEYKMQPLMQKGGIVFGLDHRITNGTPLENYIYYVKRGRELLDLPPLSPARRGWARMAG
ncbi:MAG: divalent metal cation transporter [Kiritimatiellae bacterium]|nr:divalent metal cation transporter [Kiritimatiellia bacterium]